MRIVVLIGSLALILLVVFSPGSAQILEDSFKIVDEWSFPNTRLDGFIWDAFVDDCGQLILMPHKSGIKIISSSGVRDLARTGQGPGEIAAWISLYLDGDRLIDIETYGKFIYFLRDKCSYNYEKTVWLKNYKDVPYIKGAVHLKGKWYLAGFNLHVQNPSEGSKGYFLSIFDAGGELVKQLIFKDFHGTWRAPYFLLTHIRLLDGFLWVMLASEPNLYIIDSRRDVLIKTIKLKMPKFYKPVKDYIPFKQYPLEESRKLYEEWQLSHSRIENIIVDEKNLVIQLRTADEKLTRFAVLFYNPRNFTLEKCYFSPHLLLAMKDGRMYFLENGDPGLDVEAGKAVIKIYQLK